MLDNYFIKTSVIKLIKEIKSNERYFNKKSHLSCDSFICIGNEAALYIFYEALFKYKVIVDDEFLFDEYLDQVEKLYRKLDNFDGIRFGINKLICTMLITKFGIKDTKIRENKEMIIKHVYEKYIKEGYFIHGFHPSYTKDIKEKGFTPEKYENCYDRFSKINNIFAKYNCPNIISKNFDIRDVYFTDDFVTGCYYSNYAPLFYYKFLLNEEVFGKRIRKDNCLVTEYIELTRHLKRFMNNNNFSSEDKKYILDVVEDEYNLLHRRNNKISLLVVKRNVVFSKDAKEIDFLNDNSDIYEIVDRMLSPKYNNLEHNRYIDEYEIIELDCFIDLDKEQEKIKKEEEKLKRREKEANEEFINKYGNVSIFILLGAILISLGVIIMIINILRG